MTFSFNIFFHPECLMQANNFMTQNKRKLQKDNGGSNFLSIIIMLLFALSCAARFSVFLFLKKE